MSRDYKKVIAWQHAHKLTLAIYKQTKGFPSDERFGMTSQIRRAASSVPANIAEGSGRDTNKDYLRFLIISLASLKETEYFTLLALDLQYLERNQYDQLIDSINNTMRTLQGLIKAVKKEAGIFGRFQATILATLLLTLGKCVSPFT